jgi:multisubunit Na+/H+ antiporter MnhG subunit
MARKGAHKRSRKRNHRLELAVSSGDVFSLVGALFAALKPKKMSVKEIIIIMAYVVVSAIRGEK